MGISIHRSFADNFIAEFYWSLKPSATPQEARFGEPHESAGQAEVVEFLLNFFSKSEAFRFYLSVISTKQIFIA